MAPQVDHAEETGATFEVAGPEGRQLRPHDPMLWVVTRRVLTALTRVGLLGPAACPHCGRPF